MPIKQSGIKAPKLLTINMLEHVKKKTSKTHENKSGRYKWKDYYNQELADMVYQAYWPDFEETYKEPIQDYNPAQDIERFRAWFPHHKDDQLN